MARKRKAGDDCECTQHESKVECRQAAKLEEHLGIMAMVISGSETISILVGQEKQFFIAHTDLITLHSNYFFKRLREAGEEEKLELSNADAKLFAEFYAWMYSGKPLQMYTSYEPVLGLKLWALGRSLGAPRYQNDVMHLILNQCEEDEDHGITLESVKLAYQMTSGASLLRELTADLMVVAKPFQNLKKNGPKWVEWQKLLRTCPDLPNDMAIAAASGKDWTKTRPWDAEHRSSYMEKVMSLRVKWKTQIEERSAKMQKAEGAGTPSVKAEIEEKHLRRMGPKTPRVVPEPALFIS